MRDNNRVFISYARKDGESRAVSIHRHPGKIPGVEVWMDYYNIWKVETGGGVRFRRELSSAFILIGIYWMYTSPIAYQWLRGR
jgi:hypothetical protein